MLQTIITVAMLLGAGVAVYLLFSWLALWQKKVTVQEGWIGLLGELKTRFVYAGGLADYLRPHLSNEVRAFRRMTDALSTVKHPGIMGTRSRAIAEQELRLATFALLTVAGSYHELRSDRGFISLYRKFYGSDDRVGVRSRHYNTAVAYYNATTQSRWHWLVAKLMRLQPREMFEAPAQS